ncbi:MAG: phospholipase D-like domain-containing protein [Candidatus Acidiferrales bacterium]
MSHSKLSAEPAHLIRSPWQPQFRELISVARQNLLLACPFITRSATRSITDCLRKSGLLETLRVTCLTNIRPESVLGGSLDLDGLADLGRQLGHFRLFHMPSLHAKVYIADDRRAIVTSGNLTEGGLAGNCEYGVELSDPEVVTEIRKDFEGYSRLGAMISTDEAAALARDLLQLRGIYEATERKVLKDAGRAFRKRLGQANDELLRLRARGGSTHAIFSDTIEYLLAKGPLRTVDLHPLIQRMHPDICDDRIDRIIDGFNFGKKWKHHVRTAQQALKRADKIEYNGRTWRLTNSP